MPAVLEIGPPRHYGTGAILLVYGTLIGLIGVMHVPVFGSMAWYWAALPSGGLDHMIASLALGWVIVFLLQFGLLLPFWSGSWFVRRLVVRHLPNVEPDATYTLICQATFAPRLCHGVRAALDDADDVGRLFLLPDRLVFVGDRARLVLPLDAVRGVSVASAGVRTCWLTGRRVSVASEALGRFAQVRFEERAANTVWTSRRHGRELAARLSAAVAAAQAASPSEARPTGYCGLCGQRFPADDLVRLESLTHCLGCKPIAEQMLREGLLPPPR